MPPMMTMVTVANAVMIAKSPPPQSEILTAGCRLCAHDSRRRDVKEPAEDKRDGQGDTRRDPDEAQCFIGDAERLESQRYDLQQHPCTDDIDTGGPKHTAAAEFTQEIPQLLHFDCSLAYRQL